MKPPFQLFALAASVLYATLGQPAHGQQASAVAASASHIATQARCPAEMVQVERSCVDRWEITTVDVRTHRELSPYFPPHPVSLRRVFDTWQIERFTSGDARARLLPMPELPDWQLTEDFEPMAVSREGVTPQGYLSRDVARRACNNAGKRLCRMDEWKRACRGSANRDFPYGSNYVPGACNVGRLTHAAYVLHGNASIGHLDPRLNLVWEQGRSALLRTTGATKTCVSRWHDDGIYDMVGNLDEWVDDEAAGFVGGFYARSSTKGCDARVRTHPPSYFDYSTGARCCRDAE